MTRKFKAPVIDTETHAVEPQNYYRAKHKKTQIILGGSGRHESNYLIHMKNKEYGKTKKYCTYTISRDGTIYQHYDPKYYSDFMGDKEIDKKSISIVLENMGLLSYDHIINSYCNWEMQSCPDEFVFEKNWKGCRYWEKYTDDQFLSTIKLCDHLCKKYDIECDNIGHNSREDGTKDFKGIVSRSNFDSDYLDLNPSFNFKKFLIALEIYDEDDLD